MSKNITINQGLAPTPQLSSASHLVEMQNIKTYLNYGQAYFAYTRIGQQSGELKFFPDVNSAYKHTLTECQQLLALGITGSRNTIMVQDINKNVVFHGYPKPSGNIRFSVYNGEQVEMTSNITNELNNNIIHNYKKQEMDTINTPSKTQPVMENTKHFENCANSTIIETNAQAFIDAKVLTHDNVRFLRLTEDAAKQIADDVQKAAIANKEKDNATFTEAIYDASCGMITATKQLASGKPMDAEHCSLHDDNLYCATHCKSREALFDNSNTWRKVPGKLNYSKLSAAIMETYHKGQELILETVQHISMAPQITVPTASAVIIKRSLAEFAQKIVSIMMVYVRASADILGYLAMKQMSLESDVQQFSNGVLNATISEGKVLLSTMSGKSINIDTATYRTDDALRRSLLHTVSQLIVSCSISSQTREFIFKIVDEQSIQDCIFNSVSSILSQNEYNVAA